MGRAIFGITVNALGEDPRNHFTVWNILAPLDRLEFITEIRHALDNSKLFKDHAFVFIHGYSVPFDYALYRAAQSAYDLGFDGVSALYSWPSGGRHADYVYDLDSARLARRYLIEFLTIVCAQTGAKFIHLIAHSMGNVPLLAALPEVLKDESIKHQLSQIIISAPDIDRQEFEGIAAAITEANETGQRPTLYVSKNDRALAASRLLRRNLIRAGEVGEAGPIIVKGMETMDVSALSTDLLPSNHSTYVENRELLTDMKRLLLRGEHPPDKRTEILRVILQMRGGIGSFLNDSGLKDAIGIASEPANILTRSARRLAGKGPIGPLKPPRRSRRYVCQSEHQVKRHLGTRNKVGDASICQAHRSLEV
jgi:hypothetical protein